MKVNDFYTPDDPDDIDNQEDEFKINSKEEKNNLIDKTINKFKKKIKKNVAAAGYDNDAYKGDDKAYSNLPECCQYERK